VSVAERSQFFNAGFTVVVHGPVVIGEHIVHQRPILQSDARLVCIQFIHRQHLVLACNTFFINFTVGCSFYVVGYSIFLSIKVLLFKLC